MTKGVSIKNRLFFTLVSLFLLSTSVVAFFAYRSQTEQLREGLEEMAMQEANLFAAMLTADAEGLARAQIGLTRLDGLLDLFVERDREALQQAAAPLFEEMRARNNITHMYFIDPDGAIFLRVHRPAQHSDVISRATYRQSAASGRLADGLEMGRNYFSLRSVHPLVHRGEAIGYLEVAQEIDHVFRQMQAIAGHQVSLFLAEDFLKKRSLDLGKEKVGDFVLLETTAKEQTLALAQASGALMGRGLGGFAVELVDLPSGRYAVATSPVKDADGQTTGILFSQQEVTELYAGMWRGVVATVVIFAGILCLSAFLLYLAMRRSLRLFNNLKGHILETTSSWDLTRRLHVDSGDEIGELASDFNLLSGRLAEMVHTVAGLSRELDLIASDIGGASKQVVGSAAEQSEQIQEAASAVAEIEATMIEVVLSIESLAGSAAETSSSTTEMASSFEETAHNTDNLSHSVEEVTSSIAEIISSIRQVGESVAQLVEAAGISASSVAQMGSTILQVEKNAADSAEIAGKVVQDAEQGQRSVDATIEGIRSIRQAAQATASVVTNLSGRVENIGAILSIIDEVTEKTNLLALNAAIIAAQAGEQGKGFAVVADEIKELAERTRNSTREIGAVVQGIQEDSRQAVLAMTQAEKSIAEGEQLSRQSGEVLVEIVGGVKRSVAQVEQIARAMGEQTAGNQMIRRATEKVSDMAGQIGHASREQAKAGELILRAGERMRELTRQVRTSSRDQSIVGKQIARATENIMEMIGQIKYASDEQRRGSSQITKSMEDIRQFADRNLQAVQVLDHSLTRMTEQVRSLQGEVGRFKVE